MRYIHLTPNDRDVIEEMKSSTHSEPLRRRLECLLLSHSGMPVKDLAAHFNVVRKTIYVWFDLWDTGNISAILLKEGSGAKKKLRNIPSKDILKLVEDYPQNLKAVLCRLSDDYGVKVSEKTLQRFLKSCGSDLAKGTQIIEVQTQ